MTCRPHAPLVPHAVPHSQLLGSAQRRNPCKPRQIPVPRMQRFCLFIDDTVAVASPVLARMRLDGLDRAALPFAERHVQAWRGAPEPSMESNMLMNVIKV